MASISRTQAANAQHKLSIGTVIAVAVLSIFWTGMGSLVVESARVHDFLNLYTGASLARDAEFGQLHDRQVQLSRERELVPGTDQLYPFVRPHFYAALLAPLALIPFAGAFWCWLVLQAALLVGCWAWAFRKFGEDALIFGALYLPTALGIAHGQDCIFMLAVAIAAYTAAERGNEFVAGAVLALGLMKFHLLLVVPVAMVFGRRWRLLQGFCAGGGVLGGVSVLLGGWSGVRNYVDLLLTRDVPALSPSPELMINIHSLPKNLGFDEPVLSVIGGLFVVALVWLGVRGAPLWRWFSVALAGSVLLPPHVYGYDASILLLPVWLTLFVSRKSFSRFAALGLAAPPVFFASMAGAPWSAIPALVLVTFLIALAWENHVARTQLESGPL